MFDREIADLDAAETLAAATDRHATRTEADLDLIELCLHYADLHPDPATIPGHISLPGGERGWHSGGPGCPGFAEFAAAEFGAAIGRSAGSAAALIGQTLALRHRLPRILAAIRSGHGEPWKARTIATACLALSIEAAAIVDRRVAAILDTVTPNQLDKIVKAAIQQADPDRARAAAEQNAKERGVWAGKVDEHGTTTLTIRAATGAVIRLKTTLRKIADALAELGNTDPLNQRLAMAIGIISDPTLTQELLTIANHLTQTQHTDLNTTPDAEPTSQTQSEQPAEPEGVIAAAHGAPAAWVVGDEPGADDEADRDPPHPSYDGDPHPSPADAAKHQDEPGMDAAARRELARKLSAIRQHASSQGPGGRTATRRSAQTTTLYVHLTDQTLLAGEGVTRVERFGPVFTTRLEELLGHTRIIIKPIIDLNDDRANVNAYEIPDRIREHIKLTHPVEQFPYGPAETTNSTDLDHIRPYNFTDTGPPGQTSITNLAPLRRYSHRVKTHADWKVTRLDNGALEWTTKHGLRFRVDQKGTHRLPDQT